MPNKRGGSLNNRVGWKFTGYLISEGGHQGWGDDLINGGGGWNGKSKSYVLIVNVKKQV